MDYITLGSLNAYKNRYLKGSACKASKLPDVLRKCCAHFQGDWHGSEVDVST